MTKICKKEFVILKSGLFGSFEYFMTIQSIIIEYMCFVNYYNGFMISRISEMAYYGFT